MCRIVLSLVIFLFPTAPLLADAIYHTRQILAFQFESLSEFKSYGVLLVAPDKGCGTVRFHVTNGGRFVGKTPPLAPGEVAVVRMGQGFQEGSHSVEIEVDGCALGPTQARRVTFAKRSPDHGWRAGY